MSRIKAKSEYGFWLEGQDSWSKVDKKCLASVEFKVLKKGDYVKIESRLDKKKQPWIVSVKKVDMPSAPIVEEVPIKLDQDIVRQRFVPSDAQRLALKLKCVEIVGSKFSFNDSEFESNTSELICKKSHALFEALEAADFFDW